MMTPLEFEAVKATWPWTERITPTGRGGLVQMIDRNGNEVPLFTMTKLLMMVTERGARPPEPTPAAPA